MRKVLLVLGALLVLGFVSLADDGSVVWPGVDDGSAEWPSIEFYSEATGI